MGPGPRRGSFSARSIGVLLALILVAGCGSNDPTGTPAVSSTSDISHGIVRSAGPTSSLGPAGLPATPAARLPGEPNPALTPGRPTRR